MNETLLIFLSVAEIVALVVVLAGFLLVISGQLRSIVVSLQEITWGARAVERQLRASAPNIAKTNRILEDIAATVPAAADKAERLAGMRTGVTR